MVDHISPERRSALMSKVKGKHTSSELKVRKLIHALGYRYRLHSKNLPGKPDLVFASRSKVIFVHGCFWHRHPGCSKTSTPKSHTAFWTQKFERNVSRDVVNQEKLRDSGWDVLLVWECEIGDTKQLESKVVSFLEGRA